MNNLNIEVDKNSHEIVINKLIELWIKTPVQSLPLFKEIAKEIAFYDTPMKNVYYDKTNDRFMGFSSTKENRERIAGNKNEYVVKKNLCDYLNNNNL